MGSLRNKENKRKLGKEYENQEIRAWERKDRIIERKERKGESEREGEEEEKGGKEQKAKN